MPRSSQVRAVWCRATSRKISCFPRRAPVPVQAPVQVPLQDHHRHPAAISVCPMRMVQSVPPTVIAVSTRTVCGVLRVGIVRKVQRHRSMPVCWYFEICSPTFVCVKRPPEFGEDEKNVGREGGGFEVVGDWSHMVGQHLLDERFIRGAYRGLWLCVVIFSTE